MALTFERRRELALEILTISERLTRKAGSFLGQLVADSSPMRDAQAEWFSTLAERAGIHLDGGARD
jgi:hypothetical protein